VQFKNRWFICEIQLADKSDPTWWNRTADAKVHTLIGLNKDICDEDPTIPIYHLIFFRLNICIGFIS